MRYYLILIKSKATYEDPSSGVVDSTECCFLMSSLPTVICVMKCENKTISDTQYDIYLIR